MQDLVSVITPTYNSSKYIRETIASVQNQTHSNWEMILIDDCSSDNTIEIIEEIQKTEPRIQLIKSNVNAGPAVSRNKGVGKARGNYIAFLDSDDLWKSEKLKKQLDFMKVRNIPFTFSYYEWINDKGKPLNKKILNPNPLSFSQLSFCNYVGNLTGIYSVDYFGKIPIAEIRKRQDWILWLTILQKIKVGYAVPESLAFYRKREDSLSGSKFNLLKYNYRVYRQFFKKSKVSSVVSMVKFLFVHFMIRPFYTKRIS